ncbi:hypothetical protein H0A73_12185 [Alcaligenaceae bacterium]|nr:hypothetical protein [Alcaligenaceae bacterium]
MKQTVFTICSANYLPTVKVLMDSLSRYEQASRRVLVLVEQDYAQEDAEALGRLLDCEVLRCSDLALPRERQMAFQYDITEFNTAVKPYVFQRLFDQGDEEVIYLDPDIRLYAPLDHLWEQLRLHGAVVTPHLAAPLPDDGLSPSNENMVRCGQFNFGFVGFNHSPVARRFIDWWAQRLADHCIFHPHHFYFVDQFYGAMVASFIPDIRVWHHQGYNYAYWNAPQRELARDGQGWTTPDGPLVFFHFSGFTHDDPLALSRHQNRYRAQPGSPIAELALEYADEVAANAQPVQPFVRPYSFGAYSDGVAIDALERHAYRDLPQIEKDLMGNPFSPIARERLRRYEDIADVGGSATGLLWQLWQQRQARQDVEQSLPAVERLVHEARAETEAVRAAAEQDKREAAAIYAQREAVLNEKISELQGYLDNVVQSRGYRFIRWVTEPLRLVRGR